MLSASLNKTFLSLLFISRKNSSLCFKLFMLICKYLGLEPGEDQSKTDLPAGCVARVANSCLQEVAAADLYSVVQDNAGGRSQFTFLRLVVKHLLQLPRYVHFFTLSCYFFQKVVKNLSFLQGARCSSVVRAFAHGAMGRRIDPSRVGPIELFFVPASAPRLV